MVGTLPPGRLAIGTAPLGGLYAEVADTDALRTLEAAVAAGITHFDTAPHYGRGLAEERLGTFLAHVEHPERLTVSTKVGRTIRPLAVRAADDIFLGAPPGGSVFDFGRAAVRAQLDASRRRIGRQHLDVVLVHDPDDHLDDALESVEELIDQREAGRIGAVGVGTNSAAVVHHLLDRVALDVVLLAGRITLLERSGEPVAERCAAAGITLFAAGVFQSGILAGGSGDTWDYLPAPEAIRSRVAEMRQVCDTHGETLHHVALRHPLRIPGVSAALVGVRSPAEVAAAAAAVERDVPDGLWAAIDELRDRAGGERR